MMKQLQSRIVWLVLFIGVTMWSCDTTKIYHKFHDFDNSVWHVDSLASFTFEIADASQAYDLEYNVRYAISYPYRNLYITYYLTDSSNTLSTDLQEILLFESKSGKPLGSGVGDIFDLTITGLGSYKFAAAGSYTLKVKQFMRQEELPAIMSFGLTIRPSQVTEK